MHFKASLLALYTLTGLAAGRRSKFREELMFVTGSCLGFDKRRFYPISFSLNWCQSTPSRNSCAQTTPSTNTSSNATNPHSKTCPGTDLILKTIPFSHSSCKQVFHQRCERILPLSVTSQRNLEPGSSTDSSLLLPLRDFLSLLISDTREGLNEQKSSV